MKYMTGRTAVAMVLAGGRGARLQPLTQEISKAVLPFAGGPRLVDMTLSNLANSGIGQIGIVTGYRSRSLRRYLNESHPLAASIERLGGKRGEELCAGTVASLGRHVAWIQASRADTLLVCAADHVYRLDFRELLDVHEESGRPVTVACHAHGSLEQDELCGLMSAPGAPGAPEQRLTPLGIYAFDVRYLLGEVLPRFGQRSRSFDFGLDVLPWALGRGEVAPFRFEMRDGRARYFRDIDGVEAYWQAHVDTLAPQAGFVWQDLEWPVWHAAPRSVLTGLGRSAWVGEGATRGAGATVEYSVVLPGAHIGAGARVIRAVVEAGARVPDGWTFIGTPQQRLLSQAWIEQVRSTRIDFRGARRVDAIGARPLPPVRLRAARSLRSPPSRLSA